MSSAGAPLWATALIGAAAVGVPSGPSEEAKGAIKHIVVLMEENRSFDHMFGFAGAELNVNGLRGDESNPVKSGDPSAGRVVVRNGTSYLNPCDPGHTTWATTVKIFGERAVVHGDLTRPTMEGFVDWQRLQGDADKDYCGVMSSFSPGQLPVLYALAKEFAIMDRFFCDHPGPTWPNRMYAVSGTNAGSGETDLWYRMEVGKLFPQRTIFDQVNDANKTWRNYFNDTPWEAFLETIAHNPENVRPLTEFYDDARGGRLPAFAWLNPRSGVNLTSGVGSNDEHPDHDVAAGERLIKDVYEAIRASPQWNETLLIITYDEHGGFYDHVPPPSGVPIPDDEITYPDPFFKRDRLGVRVPTILISPWIPRHTVLSAPPEAARPANNSEYTLSSIPATARRLLGITEGALTRRDAWAATFDHAMSLRSPRTDTPQHLPEPPAPSISLHREAELPLNDLQSDIVSAHLNLGDHTLSTPQTPKRQGDVSTWLTERYDAHAERTIAWKQSKAEASARARGHGSRNDSSQGYGGGKWLFGYCVECGPVSGEWADTGWDINNPRNASGATVSSKKATHDGVPLCLDAHSAREGDVVLVTPCYPSADPVRNRDPAQRWVVMAPEIGEDATLRPRSNTSLCVTNHLYQGDKTLRLEACDGRVSQHWAWHGGAPGNDHSGKLFFGDGLNILGLRREL